MKVPKELQEQFSTEGREQPPIESITAWWLGSYGESIGLLHKVHWHRIVIDGEQHFFLPLTQVY